MFELKFWISFWAWCLISKRSHLKWTWMKGKWVLISERKDSFGLESDWLNWFQFSHKPCLVHDFSRRNNYQNIISETNASSWSLAHSDSSVKHEVKNVSFWKKNSRLGPFTFIALEPFLLGPPTFMPSVLSTFGWPFTFLKTVHFYLESHFLPDWVWVF